VANLLVNLSSTAASGNAPASWAAVNALSASGVTVGATTNVLILIGCVPLNPSTTDCSIEFRFYVNGAQVGGVCQSWMDSTGGDNSDTQFMWAITGLSGSSNSFSVQWQYEQGATQAANTSRPRTFQVIELENDNAEILYSTTNVSQTSPASWGNLFNSGNLTIAGTASIVMLIAMVPLLGVATDAVTQFQFAVDTTREGAITATYCDEANGQIGFSGCHVTNGLSAGTHTFQLQWQRSTGAMNSDPQTAAFCVVEVTGSAVLESAITSTASWSYPSGSFGNDPELDADVTIASTSAVVLVAANFTMASNGTTDTTGLLGIGMDDSQSGAIISSFSDTTNIVGGSLVARAFTGISGSHSFQLMAMINVSVPSMNTSRPRTMFIISFGTTTYYVSGVTRDKDGAILGSCDVYLMKNNGDDTMTMVAHTTSNASTGVYTFSTLGVANSTDLMIIAFKDGSPNIADCTEWNVEAVEE